MLRRVVDAGRLERFATPPRDARQLRHRRRGVRQPKNGGVLERRFGIAGPLVPPSFFYLLIENLLALPGRLALMASGPQKRGRSTRTRRPLKVGSGSPLAGNDAAGLPRTLREERFYYNGIRRIQEVVIDTLVDTGTATAPPVSRLSREYVWGPGGVDELLAQFEGAPAGTPTAAAAVIQSRPWFALLDGGGDVVALVEIPPATPLYPVPQGRVAGQWTYDAYGSVTSAETLQPFPLLHA